MEIRDIEIRSLNIEETPQWLITPPMAIPVAPPVTTQIGVPIVNMPGCVEAHIEDDGKNDNLTGDDPKGVRVFCDAGIPSYDAMDYDRDQLDYQRPTSVPKVRPPETPEVKAPKTEGIKPTKIVCPTEAQSLKEPVGTLIDGGTKKIVEYRLVGKECIPVKEDVKVPDQIIQAIPTAGSVTTTASIAVVATTSALLAKPLADLLLRVVKPAVKKVIKKIAAIRGKKPKIESKQERLLAQRDRNRAIMTLRRTIGK